MNKKQRIQMQKNIIENALKLVPMNIAAMNEDSATAQKYIEENFSVKAITNSAEAFDRYMDGLKKSGSILHDLAVDSAKVVIANEMGQETGDIKNCLMNFDRISELREAVDGGLVGIMNSADESFTAEIMNSAEVLNTVEAVADGTFGLNRIVTALSVILPTLVRQKFLKLSLEQFVNASMGMSAYKTSIYRRGVAFSRPRPEEMLTHVGAEMKGPAPSLTLNQKEIKCFQLRNDVNYNTVNVKLNEQLNISVISELVELAAEAFTDAFVRGLHYGITGLKDGASFKGISNYKGTAVDNAIWTENLTTVEDVDEFLDRLTAAWRENQATQSDGDRAIVHVPDTFVMEASEHARLNKIALTASSYPVAVGEKPTLLGYLRNTINERFASFTMGQPVAITIIPSSFSNGDKLTIVEGTATADRHFLYRKEDLFFDMTLIPTAGFNTDNNFEFQLVNLAFMSEPDFAYDEQSIILIGKGF